MKEVDSMRHEKLLWADKCVLMVVDVQEAFRDHIPDFDRIVERSRVMIEAAKLLDVPIIVTEQYPKGLGRTVETLRNILGESHYYDKITFSCLQDETVREVLLTTARKQVLLVGIEAHVCVSQTVYDAIMLELEPYLAVDAIGSRRPSDTETAVRRLRDAGAIVTTTEAAIMEMTLSSKHPKFREISKLIK